VLGFRLSGAAPDGMYYSTESPGHSYRNQPLEDGGVLGIVGGEDHKTGQVDDTLQCYEALGRWGAERFGAPA
jgi:hypothetical protein